ncbi:hypothetical protein NOR53_338 [gamma proteobacterium NOR5-3]|nr:hypothetical protein NOR53_338 [gamma proteobacterium NOR5-3]
MPECRSPAIAGVCLAKQSGALSATRSKAYGGNGVTSKQRES